MRFRPLPVMTIISGISFAILVLFGNWQWDRYQSKRDGAGGEVEWAELSGTPLAETYRIVYAYAGGRSAWRLVVGYDTVEGLVFVPLTLAFDVNPPARAVLPEPLPLRIRGLWRKPRAAGPFDAPGSPEERIFYTLDPGRLASGLEPDLAGRVLPHVFEPEFLISTGPAGTGPVRNPMTEAEDAERLPPERHLGYALTWWGLAAALIGVYLAFHHQRGRLRFRQETGG